MTARLLNSALELRIARVQKSRFFVFGAKTIPANESIVFNRLEFMGGEPICLQFERFKWIDSYRIGWADDSFPHFKFSQLDFVWLQIDICRFQCNKWLLTDFWDIPPDLKCFCCKNSSDWQKIPFAAFAWEFQPFHEKSLYFSHTGANLELGHCEKKYFGLLDNLRFYKLLTIQSESKKLSDLTA